VLQVQVPLCPLPVLACCVCFVLGRVVCCVFDVLSDERCRTPPTTHIRLNRMDMQKQITCPGCWPGASKPKKNTKWYGSDGKQLWAEQVFGWDETKQENDIAGVVEEAKEKTGEEEDVKEEVEVQEEKTHVPTKGAQEGEVGATLVATEDAKTQEDKRVITQALLCQRSLPPGAVDQHYQRVDNFVATEKGERAAKEKAAADKRVQGAQQQIESADRVARQQEVKQGDEIAEQKQTAEQGRAAKEEQESDKRAQGEQQQIESANRVARQEAAQMAETEQQAQQESESKQVETQDELDARVLAEVETIIEEKDREVALAKEEKNLKDWVKGGGFERWQQMN
jgi:hypothetical protein